MRVSKTFSFNIDILTKFIEKCNSENKVPTQILSQFMVRYATQTDGFDNPLGDIIQCTKCEAKYSNILVSCPNCKGNEVAQEQLDKIEATKEMEKELKKKEIQNQIEILKDKKDKMILEYREKPDKDLRQEIIDKEKEIEALEKTIND